jgi:hypothetical protein
MFLGIDLFGDSECFNNIRVPDLKNDQYVSAGKCILDELQVSKNTDSQIYSEWNFDMILHANFEDNLTAGNVDFAASFVDCIRVKMKPSNEYRWRTVHEHTITDNNDFMFKYLFPYARGGVSYDFSLTPVFSGGIEGNINKSTIVSEFEGLYFMEADRGYHAYLNLDISHKNNRQTSIQTTLGRKYPFVISNGDSNYVSGEITATFIQNKNKFYDINGGWKYRENVNDFLMDGFPKIIKYEDGRMWLASIDGNPEEDYSQHQQMPIHKIRFVEIGDCDSTVSLYDAGLINCNVEWV